MKPEEYEIMHTLNKLKELSLCLDKQVVCAITDKDCRILSIGINQIIQCDKNCHDKVNRTCQVVHAEIVAVANLHNFNDRATTAYLNLFPCVPCQQALAHFVQEIVVFGPRHKDQWFPNIRLEQNLYLTMLEHNKRDKQLSVAQGELAELITAISDSFHRPDKNLPVDHLYDEILDAEFMLDQIKLVAWERDPETYNTLREIRAAKYARLQKKLRDNII